MEMRVPVPDPTLMTTQQLQREVGAAREVMQSRIDALKDIVVRNAETLAKQPGDFDQKIAFLAKLYDEKFGSIATRFIDRDVRSDHTRLSTEAAIVSARQAIEAAMLSAKEQNIEQNKANSVAVAKSEAATIKQIDQQGTIIATTTKALDDKISDVKERLTLIEGTMSGVSATKTDTTMSAGVFTAVVAACISAAGVVVLIVSTIINHATAH